MGTLCRGISNAAAVTILSSLTGSYHRLAMVLLHLTEQVGEPGSNGIRIKLSLTHEDLANLIGTTRETASTQISKFKRMGLLRQERRHFIVARPRLMRFICSELLRRSGLHIPSS